MLPDYPTTKNQVKQHYDDMLKVATDKYLGGTSQLEAAILQEGKDNRLHRDDGSVDVIGFPVETISAEFCLDESRIDEFDAAAVFDELGKEMAKLYWTKLRSTIERTASEVGNVFGPGENMVETLFRSWSIIEIDFDETNEPILPTSICNEQQAAEVQRAYDEIRTDASLRQRFQVLISQQRTKWRDREIARNLVD